MIAVLPRGGGGADGPRQKQKKSGLLLSCALFLPSITRGSSGWYWHGHKATLIRVACGVVQCLWILIVCRLCWSVIY